MRPAVLTCKACGAPIIWARTLAGPNGPGGKAMPLDAEPNPDGNVAARITASAPMLRRVCRVLAKDETHDHRAEQLYMPHFATCLVRQGEQLTAQVEAFLATAAEEGTA